MFAHGYGARDKAWKLLNFSLKVNKKINNLGKPRCNQKEAGFHVNKEVAIASISRQHFQSKN